MKSEFPVNRAGWLGFVARELSDLVIEQGKEVFRQRGLRTNPQCASVVLALAQFGPTTLANLGRMLGQPHQIIAQRIKLLEPHGLVTRKPDRNDARRKLLSLSAKGRKEALSIAEIISEAELVFARIYEEIGINTSEALMKTIAAFEATPMAERLKTNLVLSE